MKYRNSMIGVLIIVLDQLSKYWINATMALGESIEIIPNFFRLTNVHNTGAAWSIFEGKMIFFYLITIVFLIAMVYFYRTSEDADTFTKLGMILMMAGAVGNFIDRLALQYVRDFFDFLLLEYNFPVFNIADISLCIGVALIILSVFLESYGGFFKCEK